MGHRSQGKRLLSNAQDEWVTKPAGSTSCASVGNTSFSRVFFRVCHHHLPELIIFTASLVLSNTTVAMLKTQDRSCFGWLLRSFVLFQDLVGEVVCGRPVFKTSADGELVARGFALNHCLVAEGRSVWPLAPRFAVGWHSETAGSLRPILTMSVCHIILKGSYTPNSCCFFSSPQGISKSWRSVHMTTVHVKYIYYNGLSENDQVCRVADDSGEAMFSTATWWSATVMFKLPLTFFFFEFPTNRCNNRQVKIFKILIFWSSYFIYPILEVVMFHQKDHNKKLEVFCSGVGFMDVSYPKTWNPWLSKNRLGRRWNPNGHTSWGGAGKPRWRHFGEKTRLMSQQQE